MPRTGHAVVAAVAGVIALIAAIVLVLDPFGSVPTTPRDGGSAPSDSEDLSRTATSEPASTVAPTTKSSEAGNKPANPTTEDQAEPGGYAAALIDAIPADMLESDGTCEEPRGGEAVRCEGTGNHIVEASYGAIDDGCLDGGSCRVITGDGGSTVAYALLFTGQYNGSKDPWIRWTAMNRPGIVFLTYFDGHGEPPPTLVEWWRDSL